MGATLQDLIDRGVERIRIELASPFVEEGERFIDCCDLNEKNFEYYWQDNETYFCIALDENDEDVAFNNEPLDYLEG